MSVLSKHVADERKRTTAAQRHRQELAEKLSMFVPQSLELFVKTFYGTKKSRITFTTEAVCLCWEVDEMLGGCPTLIRVVFWIKDEKFRVDINWLINGSQCNVWHEVPGDTQDDLEKCLVAIAQKCSLKVL